MALNIGRGAEVQLGSRRALRPPRDEWPARRSRIAAGWWRWVGAALLALFCVWRTKEVTNTVVAEARALRWGRDVLLGARRGSQCDPGGHSLEIC